MSPEEVYLQHLDSVERIAAFVARRSHADEDEIAEFTQEVRFRLLEDDYAIIRKFEGRSSFTTYLTTVIVRLYHQWRVEQWGKWRPSAEAKRLGDVAVTLERLLTRDGFTFHEAVSLMTTRAEPHASAAELEAIYLRLPIRAPRPVLVSGDVAPDAACAEAEAESQIGNRERECAAREASRTMDEVLASMNAEDRLILQMRFWDGLTVAAIAAALHLDQKKLYKRIERLCGVLRRSLERAGISKADMLTSEGTDIDLHLSGLAREYGSSGPSHLSTIDEDLPGAKSR